VVGEVAPDGTLTRAQSFDVYGCVRTSSGAATTKHKFVGSLGHPSDDETGLIYMQARHYDPVYGRSASEDPGYSGKNWFAYSDSNPVNLVDKDGRCPLLFVAIIAFLAIGTTAAMADWMFQFYTKKGDVDWIEVAAVGIGGGLVGAGIAVGAIGLVAIAGECAMTQTAMGVATVISAKTLAGALVGAAWGVGFGAVLGGLSGVAGAVLYNYAHELQISAILDTM
jgi:RHS repeat-associated protein